MGSVHPAVGQYLIDEPLGFVSGSEIVTCSRVTMREPLIIIWDVSPDQAHVEGGMHPLSSKLRRELQLNSRGCCMRLDYLVWPNILGLQLLGSSLGQSQVLRGQVDKVPGRIFHP